MAIDGVREFIRRDDEMVSHLLDVPNDRTIVKQSAQLSQGASSVSQPLSLFSELLKRLVISTEISVHFRYTHTLVSFENEDCL